MFFVFFFRVVVLKNTPRECTRMGGAQAARLFVLFRPIASLAFGVPVTVAVVFASTRQQDAYLATQRMRQQGESRMDSSETCDV